MTSNNLSALITGATGGIGLAIAKKLAGKVGTIIMTGRDDQTLKEAKKEIESYAEVEVIAYKLDLEKEEDILSFADYINGLDQDLSYLIHCAGIIATGALQSASLETFDSIYKVNARAPFILTKALLPQLKKNKGQIVFTNSSVVIHSYFERGLYAYSKVALKGIADVLRQELNPDGIRVISIFPGQTATQMQQKLYQEGGKSYDPMLLIQPEDVAETVAHALELPSTAELTDIYLRPLKKS